MNTQVRFNPNAAFIYEQKRRLRIPETALHFPRLCYFNFKEKHKDPAVHSGSWASGDGDKYFTDFNRMLEEVASECLRFDINEFVRGRAGCACLVHCNLLLFAVLVEYACKVY